MNGEYKEDNMKKFTTSLALLLAVVTLTNCSSKGFESSSSTGAGSSTNDQLGGVGTGGGGTDGGGSQIPAPIDNVDLQGKVDGNNSQFGGALSFDFDKQRGEFIVMIPMPSGVFLTPSGSFSKYPDITFSPIIDATGKMKFAVRIPVKYIIKGMSTLPAASLPNGDPLPAMPSGYGELPSLGLNFPQHNNTQVSLYIGVNAIGLYVTLPTNAALPIGFTLPIRNKDKSKTYGYLTYVPAKMNYAPGLFVSAIIPPAVSRILEDYFKL